MIGRRSNSWLHIRRIFTTCLKTPWHFSTCQEVVLTCYKYSITCQDDLLTVDNAQSHVTAFRPISEAARSWSDDNNVSQGSVATHARCGEIFNIRLTANLPRNLPVKNFLKSVKICQNFGYQSVAKVFLAHRLFWWRIKVLLTRNKLETVATLLCEIPMFKKLLCLRSKWSKLLCKT